LSSGNTLISRLSWLRAFQIQKHFQYAVRKTLLPLACNSSISFQLPLHSDPLAASAALRAGAHGRARYCYEAALPSLKDDEKFGTIIFLGPWISAGHRSLKQGQLEVAGRGRPVFQVSGGPVCSIKNFSDLTRLVRLRKGPLFAGRGNKLPSVSIDAGK
jgi:hypothetical protein